MLLLLYERLRMYMDVNIVDLSYHKFEYNNKTMTQGEAILQIISWIESYFEKDDWDDWLDNTKTVEKVWELWTIIEPCMWW